MSNNDFGSQSGQVSAVKVIKEKENHTGRYFKIESVTITLGALTFFLSICFICDTSNHIVQSVDLVFFSIVI